MAKNGHKVIATAQVSPQVTPLREKAKSLGLTNLQVESSTCSIPMTSRRHKMGFRRAVEQRRHAAKRARSGKSRSTSCARTTRSTSSAAGADAGRRAELGGEQDEGQGRLHVVDGRAVHAGELGHLRLDQACTGIDRRGAAAGAGAARDQGPDHQSRRLLHRLQRDDGRQSVPLAQRHDALHQARRPPQGLRRTSSCLPTATSTRRR